MDYATQAREIAEMFARTYGCEVQLATLDSVEVNGQDTEIVVTVLVAPADEILLELAA